MKDPRVYSFTYDAHRIHTLTCADSLKMMYNCVHISISAHFLYSEKCRDKKYESEQVTTNNKPMKYEQIFATVFKKQNNVLILQRIINAPFCCYPQYNANLPSVSQVWLFLLCEDRVALKLLHSMRAFAIDLHRLHVFVLLEYYIAICYKSVDWVKKTHNSFKIQ